MWFSPSSSSSSGGRWLLPSADGFRSPVAVVVDIVTFSIVYIIIITIMIMTTVVVGVVAVMLVSIVWTIIISVAAMTVDTIRSSLIVLAR